MLCLWFAHAVTSPIAAIKRVIPAIGAFLDRNQEVPWTRYSH